MPSSGWKRSLLAIDVSLEKLHRSLDALLAANGESLEVARDLLAVLEAIPEDVLERAQHPLSVAAKDLRGSIQQTLDARKLEPGENAPEWLSVVDEGARAAIGAFEQSLAKLLKDGAAEH